jgi:type IV pilus assembly protein PilY1
MRRAAIACLLVAALHCHAAPAAEVPAEPAVCAGAGPSAVGRSPEGPFVIQTGAQPGSVRRHALIVTADGAASTDAVAVWDGAALPAPEGRKIYTFTGLSTVPFTWSGLPSELRALLDADGQGEARTAYLRGERGRELGQPGGLFRRREGVLGDVVHSVPLIVGAPSASDAGEGHDAFRVQAAARPTAVYVGAGDGMLHAFSAADGTELFAYVPRVLVGGLADFGGADFRGRPFVDGSPGQGDAVIGARWRTVLASGMGKGARGVFALDISNPAAFAQNIGALWEFTDADDPAIGFVHAAPQIIKLNVGARGSEPVYRYFAIVPSGAGSQAANGNGALFLLALDKPSAQPWQEGRNYYRIGTSGADPARPNALSAPGLVTSADGSVLLAYAGDLQGRLWRFDLAARTAQRVFTARDASGRVQPIVHAPKVVFASGGGYLVLFGTGKLSEPSDFLSSSYLPQSLYAIHDRLEVPAVPIASRAELAQRTLSGFDNYTVHGAPVDYFGPAAQRGWYLDFPNTGNDGERVAGSPSVTGGAVIFNSVLPGAHQCAAAASRTYVLDALTGLVAGQRRAPTAELTALVTLLPPLVVETGAAMGARDAAGGAVATRTFSIINAGPAGRKVTVQFPARRLGWREVDNWQELHDAANR